MTRRLGPLAAPSAALALAAALAASPASAARRPGPAIPVDGPVDINELIRQARIQATLNARLYYDYSFRRTTRVENLDAEGRVKSTETRVYRVIPSREGNIRHLLKADGEPPPRRMVRKQRARNEKIRKRWEKIRKRQREARRERQRQAAREARSAPTATTRSAATAESATRSAATAEARSARTTETRSGATAEARSGAAAETRSGAAAAPEAARASPGAHAPHAHRDRATPAVGDPKDPGSPTPPRTRSTGSEASGAGATGSGASGSGASGSTTSGSGASGLNATSEEGRASRPVSGSPTDERRQPSARAPRAGAGTDETGVASSATADPGPTPPPPCSLEDPGSSVRPSTPATTSTTAPLPPPPPESREVRKNAGDYSIFELLSLTEHEHVGTCTFEDRVVHVVHFFPRDDFDPLNPVERVVTAMAGSLFIDAHEFQVLRAQGATVAPVKWGAGLVALKEAEFELETIEVNDEVWLPRYNEFYFDTRVIFDRDRKRITHAYDDYKPIRVETREEYLGIAPDEEPEEGPGS